MPLLLGEGGRPQLPCPGLEGKSKEAVVDRVSWTACHGPTAPVGGPLPAPPRCTPGPEGGGQPQWNSDSLCSPANQGNRPVHTPRPWRSLGPNRPAGLGSGTGLEKAVLPKTRPRAQRPGRPALPCPLCTVREHALGGWHASALSEALPGREQAESGLPSSPQGWVGPDVRVAWVPGWAQLLSRGGSTLAPVLGSPSPQSCVTCGTGPACVGPWVSSPEMWRWCQPEEQGPRALGRWVGESSRYR